MKDKVEQYYKLIYKVMSDLHCDKDEEKQDDYFFQGLMGLYNGIKTYNPDSSTKEMTYYYVCIKNAIIVKFHSNSAIKKTAIQEISIETPIHDGLILKDILKSNLDLDRELIKQEQLEAICNVLNKTKNSSFKNYLCDFYGIGCSRLKLKEIAQKYGVSVHNVSASLRQGIKSFKKKVMKEYERKNK